MDGVQSSRQLGRDVDDLLDHLGCPGRSLRRREPEISIVITEYAPLGGVRPGPAVPAERIEGLPAQIERPVGLDVHDDRIR